MSIQVKKTPSHLFDYLAFALIIAGIGLFYFLHINIWFKWAIMLVSITGAVATFFLLSPKGLELHGYVQDSWKELGKVVWPSRKEATQFTWIVILFVIILGLFLWLIDSSLSWLFYGVILGRGN